MGKNVWIWEPMISADKLYERWTGIHGHEEELAKLIDSAGDPFRDDTLPIAYRVLKVLDANEKGIASYCEECIPANGEKYHSPYSVHYGGDETYYEFRGVAFLRSQIMEYEKNHPELFYKVIENPDAAWETSTPLHPGLRTISAYEVIRKLRITPIELVDILNGIEFYDDYGNPTRVQRLITTNENGFRNFTYNEPYFTEDMLEKVEIYQRDFDKYCEQWGPQIQALSDSEEINDVVREMRAELLRLKQENAEQQKKIRELEAQLSAPAPISNKTERASEAKQEKALEGWKAAFPCMVRVYARMEQGRTYQKKEMAELFAAEGVNLKANREGRITDERLRYFCQAFTDSGRPISDLTKCGLPDESAATITDMALPR